ncbi:Isochorismatase-like protein [Flagelloscypha sp. PMI_526]|nr:Isochorismatase-like protein [Flagelloscypha sp. PMI_526]
MSLDPQKTVFFLCDIQTKFQTGIYGWEHLIHSANKLLRFAKVLDIKVIVTTQYAKGLGPIDPALDLSSLGPLVIHEEDKSLFSMLTPSVLDVLKGLQIQNVVLFGIESHVCILQTALDLMTTFPHLKVLIPHDAISSTSFAELNAAVPLLRQSGASITTTESIGFRLISDASHPKFKQFSQIVKESKDATGNALDVLVLGTRVQRSAL